MPINALALVLCMTGPEQTVSAEKLAADWVILKRAYTTLHPGLYRYNTREGLEAGWEGLRRDWGRDQPLAEAYLSLSRFLATIRCGHTYANFFNQSDRVAAALFERRDKVPFCFRWLGERMVVTRDHSKDNLLPVGTEILEVNGVPSGRILKALMPYARADGSNDAKRRADLEVSGLSRLEAFDVFFALVFPNEGESFKLRLRRPQSGSLSDAVVPAITMDDRVQRRSATGEDPWRLEFRSPGLAVLTMDSWVMYKSKWDWRGYLREVFGTLQKRGVKHLVLDIRKNEGGDAVGDVIAGHLSGKPVVTAIFEKRVRYQSVPDDLRPYLDTWDRSFFDWKTQARPRPDGDFDFRRTGEVSTDSIAPLEPTFKGRVFVLTSPVNSSATFLFAQTVRKNKLGTLVGQPTGGSQRGINGGSFFFLRLPHSGLEVDLPLVGVFAREQRPDTGIAPDVLVETNAAILSQGRDAEMETVARLIREAGQKRDPVNEE